MARKKMVFFVSEKNSCRSIIAQAYLLKHGFEQFDCQSFGLKPDRIHYLVQEVLQERGFNSTFYFSKGFDMVKHQPVDVLISLHSSLQANLPRISSDHQFIQWNFEDPTLSKSSESQIKEKISELANLLEKAVLKFIQDYK
jgi:arsenate reductase (thioredoxin)